CRIVIFFLYFFICVFNILFFFMATLISYIYTLSLPDALPISPRCAAAAPRRCGRSSAQRSPAPPSPWCARRRSLAGSARWTPCPRRRRLASRRRSRWAGGLSGAGSTWCSCHAFRVGLRLTDGCRPAPLPTVVYRFSALVRGECAQQPPSRPAAGQAPARSATRHGALPRADVDGGRSPAPGPP